MALFYPINQSGQHPKLIKQEELSNSPTGAWSVRGFLGRLG